MIRRVVLVALLAVLMVGCATDAPEPDAIDKLLGLHGWKAAGPREVGANRLPADLRLKPGEFPWRVIVDLSRDVGLDAEQLAGQEVTMVSLPVKDVRGGRLEDLKQHVAFRAYVLLESGTGHPAAAYLVQTGKDGEILSGGPGPSLSGRDLHEITGLSWPEYLQKYRAVEPPAAVAEAEKPRNAIRAFFRAAEAQDCQALGALIKDDVNVAFVCGMFEPLASIRVIEILGYAKTDALYGFRFLADDEISDQYYVILEMRYKPDRFQLGWIDGANRRVIPVAQDSTGAWRVAAPSRWR